MMGTRQVEQDALFYEFSIESHVPADHLVRSIDRFVELGELRRQLAPFYSETGRHRSISLSSMMPHSALPHRSCRSSSPRQILPPAGAPRMEASPSSPTLPTTLSISITRSLLMSKRRPRSAKPRSQRQSA